MQDRYLTATELADRLGVSRSYIYKLMRGHGFPRQYKLGKRSVWKLTEVEEWMQQQPRGEVIQ